MAGAPELTSHSQATEAVEGVEPSGTAAPLTGARPDSDHPQQSRRRRYKVIEPAPGAYVCGIEPVAA
jgi:hypothetical protein